VKEVEEVKEVKDEERITAQTGLAQDALVEVLHPQKARVQDDRCAGGM